MKILTRNYLKKRATNIFTFGYPMKKTDYDQFNVQGGSEYMVTNSNHVFQVLPSTYARDKFIYIGFFYNGVFISTDRKAGENYIKIKIY